MPRFLALAPLLFFSTSAPNEVDVDPQPADSFTALCQGPWKHADAVAPYRGVVVEDNGSGQCCSLGGDAFMCNMHPGHQHGPVVMQHLRFYDGTSKAPRADLVWHAFPNPGMNPRSDVPRAPSFAELELWTTADGFVLTPISKKSCAPASADARDVCKNAGAWALRNGVPKRA